jgi:hypothetical protein
VLVAWDGALAIAPTGNDGNSAGVPQRATQAVGIIAPVGQQVAHAACAFEYAGAALMSLTLPGVSINA